MAMKKNNLELAQQKYETEMNEILDRIYKEHREEVETFLQGDYKLRLKELNLQIGKYHSPMQPLKWYELDPYMLEVAKERLKKIEEKALKNNIAEEKV